MSAAVNVAWRNRDVLDFYALLLQVWNGRWWIIAAAFCGASLGWLVAKTATPLYEASAALVPVSAERVSLGYSVGSTQAAVPTLSAAGGVAALARLGVNSSREANDEALAVLMSREFGYRFIEDLRLMPLLFASQWDVDAGAWKVPDAERPTAADAYEYFDRDIRKLEQDRRTGLMTLVITWHDRDVAAAWVNEIIERLNGEMRRRAVERADASLRFLETEIENVTVVDARDGLNDLIEAQINERMLASVSDEFAFRVVDRALPPGKGDIVWPSTLLLTAAGWVIGSVVGVISVIVFRAFRP